MSVAVKLASDMGHPGLWLSREADSSASLHPSEQRPLAGAPGLRNDKTKRGGMTNKKQLRRF
jgi:hypothetical protein